MCYLPIKPIKIEFITEKTFTRTNIRVNHAALINDKIELSVMYDEIKNEN